jgi:molybdate transport system substrate-binding protein
MTRPFPIRAAEFFAVLLGLVITASAAADEIRVAVASNFANAIKEIAWHFERQTAHEVTLVFGSTGKHYAQIKHGAPFDAFFAADAKRPRLLEEEGLGVPGSRFTYAVGKLILWSPKAHYVDPRGKVLEQGEYRHLALANPRLAPYGRAAQEVLQKNGQWLVLRDRMVRGENIGQTFQFVKSGNAELGFVAWSQIKRPGQPTEGSWWEIPQALYSPIDQQAVLLQDNAAARAFLTFVRGQEALDIIGAYGYGTT